MTPPAATPRDAVERIAGGAFVLDVRQPDEWTAVRIADASLIPLGELSARVAEIPRDRTVVVVCRSGNRSATATAALLAAGYDAVNLDGGMIAWAAAGLSTVGG